MFEGVIAAAAILIIIPGWAVGLLAALVYLWRRFSQSRSDTHGHQEDS